MADAGWAADIGSAGGCVLFYGFFPAGEYRNWGVGGVYVIVLWPAVLLVVYAFTAVFGAEQT